MFDFIRGHLTSYEVVGRIDSRHYQAFSAADMAKELRKVNMENKRVNQVATNSFRRLESALHEKGREKRGLFIK